MHNITDRDKVFSVRQPSWHGLATILDDYPSADEARLLVHPWEPESEPCYRGLDMATLSRDLISIFDEADEADRADEAWSTLTLMEKITSAAAGAQQLIDGWKLNARSDDKKPLGVTTSSYELVLNQEMWDIAEAIGKGDNRGDVMFETGGSLGGGAKVWVLIRLKDPISIGGDPRGATIPYYALQNDHTSAGSFRGQATFTRIICQNTALMADMNAQAMGTEFVFSHTSGIHDRIAAAKEALAGWRAGVDAYQLMNEHLVSFKVTNTEKETFLSQFIPMPQGEVVSEIVRDNIEKARAQWRTCNESVTGEGTRLTAYGLVQSSIEYSQWCRKKQSEESGFKRAFLDKSLLTKHAVRLAKEVSGA